MEEQVREEVDRFLAERRARGAAGGQGGRVAQGAADLGKHSAAASGGRRLRGRLRRREEPHERGEFGDVAERLGHGRRPEVRDIFGSPIEQTRGGLIALRREQLARDPHLDVVGFSREEQEGLVLGLPAEPCDAAVIAARIGAARPLSIRPSDDSQRGPARTLLVRVRQDRGVLDLLDQASAEDRRRDAKDQIVAGRFALEVWLGQDTPGGIGPAGDGVDVVDASVARAVALELKPRLADRPGGADEEGDDVPGPGPRRHRDLRIGGRTRAPDGRLRVTCAARVGVEPRPQARLHRLDLEERREPGLEERLFGGRQPRQRAPGPGRLTADARIFPLLRRGGTRD